MTTIEISNPGSDREPIVTNSEELRAAAHALRGTAPGARHTRIEFSVYGTEFCRMLAAVALFQADPKKFDVLAAVRCIVSGDGLYLAAMNGSSAAAGAVATIDTDGVGPFSISHEHVKSILSIFKQKLPKGAAADEYVLELTVTDEHLVIADVSKLFGGDSLTMALPPVDSSLEHGQQSDTDRVLAAFSTLAGGTADDHPEDLAAGIYFAPGEVARLGRAAGTLGVELSMRTLGRRLVAPLDTDFIAYTTGTLRRDDKEKPPFRDQRALVRWRDRLVDLEQGAL